jgi:hypothetical protein
MVTSTEDLIFIVNGNNVTKKIPVDTINIVNEYGNRVSTADFVIEDGAGLDLQQWQTVLIQTTDLTTTIFNGLLSKIEPKKRGVKRDYTVSCLSIEIRLQNAIINGTFSGTDEQIIADILDNAYPDLTDIFDWSSGITPLITDPISMDFQDLNLLDALSELSARVDNAPFDQGYSDTVTRINMIRNPAITNNMVRYGSSMVQGWFGYASYGGSWNPANTVYSSSGGESGGGIVITSQTGAGAFTHSGYVRIGRDSESDNINTTFHIERATDKWLAIRFRSNATTAAASIGIRLRGITYNEDGTVYHNGASIGPISFPVSGSWQDWDNSIDLSNAATIPESGWIEFQLVAADATNSFVLNLDSFLMEILDSVSEPVPGAYFDGETANSYWTSTANDSTSINGGNKLTWGTNDDAPFDLDIGVNDDVIEDFNIDFEGFDGINSLIVTGGNEYIARDWTYRTDGINWHYDLEETIFPQDTFTFPEVYTNIGTDAVPIWSGKTVAAPQDGFAAGDVLYDLEKHWLEFPESSPPPDLKKGIRIVGRMKRRLRTIVSDDASIASTGVEMVDTIYNDNITSASDAYELGQVELERRKPNPTVTYTTMEPGLLPNQLQNIVDSSQSFDEDLVIYRVTRKYLGGGYGKFAVEAGRYSAELDDILKQTDGNAEKKVPVDQPVETVTVAFVVDADGAQVVDADGARAIDIEVV